MDLHSLRCFRSLGVCKKCEINPLFYFASTCMVNKLKVSAVFVYLGPIELTHYTSHILVWTRSFSPSCYIIRVYKKCVWYPNALLLPFASTCMVNKLEESAVFCIPGTHTTYTLYKSHSCMYPLFLSLVFYQSEFAKSAYGIQRPCCSLLNQPAWLISWKNPRFLYTWDPFNLQTIPVQYPKFSVVLVSVWK